MNKSQWHHEALKANTIEISQFELDFLNFLKTVLFVVVAFVFKFVHQ